MASLLSGAPGWRRCIWNKSFTFLNKIKKTKIVQQCTAVKKKKKKKKNLKDLLLQRVAQCISITFDSISLISPRHGALNINFEIGCVLSTVLTLFRCDSVIRWCVISRRPWWLHTDSFRQMLHQKWYGVVPLLMHGHSFVHSGWNFDLYLADPAFASFDLLLSCCLLFNLQ